MEKENQEVKEFLNKYEISCVNGFMGDEIPLRRLKDEYYEPWERIMDNLSAYLQTDKIEFYKRINELPILKLDKLKTRLEERRACVVLSFLSHAYIFAESTIRVTEKRKGEYPSVLPKQLALPWWEICKKFEMAPIMTYYSLIISNWGLLNEKSALSLSNAFCLNLFLGGIDEAWFYLVPIEIEVQGAPGILFSSIHPKKI
jgi:indoleamine 2,3-dioxygenase